MAKGDLLFHRGTSALTDRIILATTQPGDFVHVGISWGDGLELAAEAIGGVRVRPVDEAATDVIACYHLGPQTTVDRLALACAWVSGQVHDRYGFADVISQIARLVRWPFYVAVRHTYDCSDLAACFLALALQHEDLWCWVLDNRQQITPNALAAYLHMQD